MSAGDTVAALPHVKCARTRRSASSRWSRQLNQRTCAAAAVLLFWVAALLPAPAAALNPFSVFAKKEEVSRCGHEHNEDEYSYATARIASVKAQVRCRCPVAWCHWVNGPFVQACSVAQQTFDAAVDVVSAILRACGSCCTISCCHVHITACPITTLDALTRIAEIAEIKRLRCAGRSELGGADSLQPSSHHGASMVPCGHQGRRHGQRHAGRTAGKPELVSSCISIHASQCAAQWLRVQPGGQCRLLPDMAPSRNVTDLCCVV